MASLVTIRREEAEGPEIEALLAEREAYLDGLYPGRSGDRRRAEAAHVATLFFTAWLDGRLAGCGALVPQDGYGELKRIFVRPQARRSGIGSQLVARLEAEALARGLPLVRLEVGIRQPEARALYLRAGYGEIGPFGTYRADPLSGFLEKALRA